MESVQLAVVRTGGTWAWFVIATDPRELLFSTLYWDGMNWVSERRRAMLYADPELAERDLVKLREKMWGQSPQRDRSYTPWKVHEKESHGLPRASPSRTPWAR